MNAIFLGDSFSLEESGFFGRAFANRNLVMSILLNKSISYILTTSKESAFESLHLPEQVKQKLIFLRSLQEVNDSFEKYNVRAIVCSDFVANYSNWIHFRNLKNLRIPVFGFTHSLSYQRFTSSIYQILSAQPQEGDAILCTSDCAVDVMQRLFKKVKSTLNFLAGTPSFIRFPLAYEGGENAAQIKESGSFFQVLYLGRLDWQTKADLLVLTGIIKSLPSEHRIRFVIAGAVDNTAYLDLLQHYLIPLGVDVRLSVGEEEKRQLYRESHVLFSPSDNYQETFGLTLLEAKHYGCVPVVTDFDGYRNLVADGQDGFLLKTIAAPIPEALFSAQHVVSEATYHGWWAAGVSFDPLSAARLLYSLSKDHNRWKEMSETARHSVSQYNLSATAERFAQLINSNVNLQSSTPNFQNNSGESAESIVNRQSSIVNHQSSIINHQYPYQWDFAEIFSSYPSGFWKDQEVILTDSGEEFLKRPYGLPQFMLLSGSVNIDDIRKFLFLVRRGYGVSECLQRDVEPIVMSLSLKNGLISMVDN